MQKTKIAIFDFCGTIVDFQSADAFVEYVVAKQPSKRSVRIEKIRRFLYKTRIMTIFGLLKISLNKKMIALKLKNISADKVEKLARDYYEEVIKKHYISYTLECLERCKSENMHIILISAGYKQYLDYVAKDLFFDYLISTRLIRTKNVMNGKISKDVIGKRKKVLLYKYLNSKFGHGNYQIEFSISDAKSDFPVLMISKEAIVMSKMSKQKWVPASFKEVIINEKNKRIN